MPKLTFALNTCTAEQRNNGYWYYGDTYRDEPNQYRGPYGRVGSATLMIAREMTKEIRRRRERQVSHMTPNSAEQVGVSFSLLIRNRRLMTMRRNPLVDN